MNEVEKVRVLGEEIGYGNLMAIASALWRKLLREKDLPISGAFVPVMLDELSIQQLERSSIVQYDKIIKESE